MGNVFMSLRGCSAPSTPSLSPFPADAGEERGVDAPFLTRRAQFGGYGIQMSQVPVGISASSPPAKPRGSGLGEGRLGPIIWRWREGEAPQAVGP